MSRFEWHDDGYHHQVHIDSKFVKIPLLMPSLALFTWYIAEKYRI
jgi:hypothetical protein